MPPRAALPAGARACVSLSQFRVHASTHTHTHTHTGPVCFVFVNTQVQDLTRQLHEANSSLQDKTAQVKDMTELMGMDKGERRAGGLEGWRLGGGAGEGSPSVRQALKCAGADGCWRQGSSEALGSNALALDVSGLHWRCKRSYAQLMICPLTVDR